MDSVFRMTDSLGDDGIIVAWICQKINMLKKKSDNFLNLERRSRPKAPCQQKIGTV